MKDSPTSHEDSRVKKTKQAIRNAFVKLLAQKDFNEITVKNIATEAHIDRKTLYNHYRGIHAIREELENDFIRLLDDAITELDLENNVKNPLHIFEILNDIINANLEINSYLMQLEVGSHYWKAIAKLLKDKLLSAIKHTRTISERCNAEMLAEFITSGLLAVYQNWFHSDRSYPLEEITREAGQLVVYGFHDYITD